MCPNARHSRHALCLALALAWHCLPGCGSDEGPAGQSPHQELHAVPDATGAEPAGLVPVCCTQSPEERALADEVFRRLNAYRAEHGLPALERDEGLAQAIQGHCHHMAVHPFFGHTAPEAALDSPWARAEMCGSSANGENIAAGQSSPADVMESWQNSPGHDANMRNARFRRVGIGAYVGGEGAPYSIYWGQLFGM